MSGGAYQLVTIYNLTRLDVAKWYTLVLLKIDWLTHLSDGQMSRLLSPGQFRVLDGKVVS